MSKSYVIKNLGTESTSLQDGNELTVMTVANTTSTEQTFSMLVDGTYFIKDVAIPANVSFNIDNGIIYDTTKIEVLAGSNNSFDVVYTIK